MYKDDLVSSHLEDEGYKQGVKFNLILSICLLVSSPNTSKISKMFNKCAIRVEGGKYLAMEFLLNQLHVWLFDTTS